MKANLIKTLKNNAELVDIEAGRSARRNFPGVDFENAVLIINGRIAEPDTIIQDGDVVTLRQIPADLTDTPWWVATFIIPFGFLIQPAQLAAKAKKEAEEADREIEKLKKMTNQPAIENLPFLRGATNTIATGKSQPYICGRNFLTPYLFSQPHYKIAGSYGKDQYVYNILEGGFNGIVLEKLGIGDTNILTLGGNIPQTGVYNINMGVFASGQIEIRQDGSPFQTLTELNVKTVSSVVNSEISPAYKVDRGDAEDTILTLDPNTQLLEISYNFPYGLYKYKDDGDREAVAANLYFYYSLDGGVNWVYMTERNWLENRTDSLRAFILFEFGYSHYVALKRAGQSNIMVKVRLDVAESDKIRSDCYVYYYQAKVFDPLKSSAPAGVLNDGGAAGLVPCLNVEARERAKSCIIGIKLKATKANEKKLSQINIIATSTARTWNGSSWSEGKSPTRNPAAIALEILTSDTHPASRYDDSEIDLDAFGALYEYCENNDLYFDYIITQNQKKDATLQIIADVCGCAFYKDIYGRRSVAIDQVQENALAVYNPQNIISLTNKKTFARRVDALRIKYIESAGDTFKENTYTVVRLENGRPVTIDENSIIKEINATGITRHAQVVKYGRRLMAIDELRPVTTTLKIGYEGVYFTPYAKIAIQDPSINRDAQDTIIESVTYQNGLLKKITLKQSVTFTDPLKLYGIVINTVNANGAVPVALKVDGTGTTRELDVLTTYSASNPAPAAGNVASFGELDNDGEFSLITHEYVITRIARAEGGINLDLQEYNEAIYNPGTIPAYIPLVNNTPTPAAGEIPPDAVTHDELDEAVAGITVDNVQAAVDTIQNGYRFTNIYNVRPVTDTLEEIIARMDDDARNQSASISISEDEILLQVQDMERELVGLIDIQAGSVTALVEGGGATGQMSLSLNLPVMIDATKRQQLIAASTEAKVNAVYGLVENTAYYGIKGNASSAAVKALWDDAVAAGLIASQIDLTATQIKIAADNIYIGADVIINNENKIKAALIEVENLLASSVTVKDKGVIKSANYNGTIDSNGNITAYGSLGWAIDHAGKADFVNLNATGGTFRDGFFSGLLDCGIFKIAWDTIRYTILKYETSQKDEFYQYLIDKYGYNYNYNGNTSGLYGENVYFNLNGVLYSKIYIQINEGRATNSDIYVYNESVQTDGVLIYERMGSAVITVYELYYPYWIEYVQNNALIMNIDGLPTYDPHVVGRAWNSGGTLRISAG